MDVQIYNTLCIGIPEEFEPAGEEERKAFYGFTPMDYAFLEKEKGASIGIVCTGATLTNEEVENKISAYQQHYSRMVPGFRMGELRKKELGGLTVAFMTYKANAPTRDLYNVLAITAVEGKEVLILFSCDMKDAPIFMYRFIDVLESIKLV